MKKPHSATALSNLAVDAQRSKGAERAEKMNRLVEALEPNVRSMAHRFFKNEADVDDVSQSILLRIACSLDRYDGRASLLSWVKVLSRNQCLDVLRQHGRREAALGSHPDDGSTPEACDPGQIDPLELASQKECSTVVRQAFERISPALSRTAHMRFIQGYNQREVAERLRISVGTVKSRSHRALVALRDELHEEALLAS